jgi:hypothetical protein
MNGWAALGRFLHTDPLDAGCAQTMALLDVYAELELAQRHPQRRYPGVAAHLAVCAPCATDLTGLIALARPA